MSGVTAGPLLNRRPVGRLAAAGALILICSCGNESTDSTDAVEDDTDERVDDTDEGAAEVGAAAGVAEWLMYQSHAVGSGLTPASGPALSGDGAKLYVSDGGANGIVALENDGRHDLASRGHRGLREPRRR